MMTEHFIKALDANPDRLVLDMPLATVRQLESIASASLRSDPVIRNVDDETVSRLHDLLKAKTEEGPLEITKKDFDALALVLTAVATEDLDDVGVHDEDIEDLEKKVWEIKSGLSGPRVA